MELGIAIDGEGRLGRPAAVTALARAADRLGYGAVWCTGPWASALVGAVAVVTHRVRIGLEASTGYDIGPARAAAGGRLVVAERLLYWSDAASGGSVVRLDVAAATAGTAAADLQAAARAGVSQVVVFLVDDPGLDEALAAYAELGELVEGAAALS